MRIFCSICKEIFIPYSEVKITDCGHLYHGSCISRWTKQHRTCPQCRTNITQPFRVFFDVEKDDDTDPSALEHQVETLSDKLRESENLNRDLQKQNENYERIMNGMKECAVALRQKKEVLTTSIKVLKEQVINLSKENEKVSNLENEVEMWKTKVNSLQRVENLVRGSADEVNRMIENTPVTQLAVRQLCTYVGILKVQLNKSEAKNVAFVKENRDLMKSLNEEKRKYSSETEEIIKNLRTDCSTLKRQLHDAKKLLWEYKNKDAEKNEMRISSQAPNKPVFDMNLDVLNRTENRNIRKHSSAESSKTIQMEPNDLEMGFDFLDDIGNKSREPNKNNDFTKSITHWEEMVCAGPNRKIGKLLNKSKSICSTFSNFKYDKELSRSNSHYAFDGMGGRKRIRLGGPTPREEFENIKKKEDKKSAPAIRNNTIYQYCQIQGNFES